MEYQALIDVMTNIAIDINNIDKLDRTELEASILKQIKQVFKELDLPLENLDGTVL